MKFGKTIETSAKELPEDWQPYIIQYKLLKKNIKGIVKELDDTFKTLNLLPPTTLNDAGDAISVSDQSCGRSIISEVGEHGGVVDIPDSASVVSVTSPTLSAYVGSPEEIEYHIEKDSDGVVHPVITVTIRKPASLQNDEIVELPEIARLPSDASTLLPRVHPAASTTGPLNVASARVPGDTSDAAATSKGKEIDTAGQMPPPPIADRTSADAQSLPKLISGFGDSMPPASSSSAPSDSGIRIETRVAGEMAETQVTVRLQADQLFFDQLINYIDRTRAFEKEYTKQYNSNVTALGSELTTVTSPFKHDFQIWREIFRLYLDADVWSHTEGDFRPTNTAKEGQERFAEFTQHIKKLGLANKFRDSVSAKLLMSFYKLNSELMYMKLLQEMNEEATRKILKKHDKRTHLVAKTQFPQFVTFDTTSLTKALIYTIYTDLVGIVPQIDDYLCPMCLNIAWRPLRLECNHIFCSRCVVKASRRHMFDCPVCRAKGAIYRAGVENIDKALLNFMKLYFPREVKEKQRDIQQEISEDETRVILSSQSGHKPCIIM